MRILGIDPGLNHTGWGIVTYDRGTLSFVDAGIISPPPSLPLAERLRILSVELTGMIQRHKPDEAGIEETFVNKSGSSTLKLGQARGALMLTVSLSSLNVSEYAATMVKKAVTGSGHAGKEQVGRMVNTLLPASRGLGADALDALAVAICHTQCSKLDAALQRAKEASST